MSTTQQPVSDAILTQILGQLEALQVSQQALQAKVRAEADNNDDVRRV